MVTNWHLVAGLLLRLERNDIEGEPAEIWRELQADRHQTVLTFSSLDGVACWSAFEKREAALHQLFRRYPNEIRSLFEWALDHADSVPVDQVRRRGGRDHFVIRALGQVGDMATVERLRVHVLDPDGGGVAVDAIREIHERQHA